MMKIDIIIHSILFRFKVQLIITERFTKSKDKFSIGEKVSSFKMAARRRLMKEFEDLKKSGPKYFRDVHVDEQNLFQWQGLLVPEAYPFNKGKTLNLTSDVIY